MNTKFSRRRLQKPPCAKADSASMLVTSSRFNGKPANNTGLPRKSILSRGQSLQQPRTWTPWITIRRLKSHVVAQKRGPGNAGTGANMRQNLRWVENTKHKHKRLRESLFSALFPNHLIARRNLSHLKKMKKKPCSRGPGVKESSRGCRR